MELFKNNWTKWIPLATYSFAGVDTMVFVRKNNKTGLMGFKQKLVNCKFRTASLVCSVVPRDLIDIKEQWEKINKL